MAVGGAKSKMVAALWAFLFGQIGAHRFYLGYTSIGVAMLVICLVGGFLTLGVASVIVWLWGVAEGIMILTGAIGTDADGRPLVN